MFSISFKRSAATLGVVAGLLAAAAPANAVGLREDGSQGAAKAPTTPTANGFIIDFAHTGVKAPTNAGPRNAAAEQGTWGPIVHMGTAGTQVGSEGVDAPAYADHRMKDKAVVVLIGANDYGWTHGNDNPAAA